MTQSLKTFLVVGSAVIIITILLIGLGNALLPLLIAFGLAYLSFPLIHGLEKRRIKRNYAVAGVFSLIAAVVTLILLLIIPGLIKDTKLFFHELPQTSAIAIEKLEHLSSKFGYDLDISEEGLKDILAEHASAISGDFLKSSSLFLRGIFSNVMSGLLMILNLFLVPLFYFHLVNKYEAISKETQNLLPIPWRPKINQYSQLINTVLSGYIRGQILVALILACLYGIGFFIIGLRFGFLIGIGTGLLSIIPFVGSILGFIVAITVALANFTGLATIMGVTIVFVVIQGLEGLVITPKLVGDKVGLSDLTTMLALIIGGNLLGFAGMIIAIPIAAILKSIILDLRREYQALKFYAGPSS
ncbi:MAG: AI-2E family transporter [Bdellovibrio sp.]|nr:AI-2E family transporter [Bdellovibrio sp.]